MLLQNGVTIGSDGFGFARRGDGSWHKIPQTGIVVIEDDVEVQAHTAIDRATIGETRIGHGTKIDNLVQVGHSCKVGEHTLLCGQVGLAGTSRTSETTAFSQGKSASPVIFPSAMAPRSPRRRASPTDVPAGAVYSAIPPWTISPGANR